MSLNKLGADWQKSNFAGKGDGGQAECEPVRDPWVLKANHGLSRSSKNVDSSQRELIVTLCFGTCDTASAELCPVWASTVQDAACILK